MHDVHHRVADLVLELEAELRKLGWWEGEMPSDRAMASTQPFCIDTLRLEQWLQWVLIPRMKAVLENHQPLPQRSDIYVYAEEVWRGQGKECLHLLVLLRRFDELIAIQASGRRH